jgi:hypothetical protein
MKFEKNTVYRWRCPFCGAIRKDYGYDFATPKLGCTPRTCHRLTKQYKLVHDHLDCLSCGQAFSCNLVKAYLDILKFNPEQEHGEGQREGV